MTKEPRSTLTHRQWMQIATEEYRRTAALLAALPEAQWQASTDCAGWTVRDIVAHLIGAAEAGASIGEQLRQQRLGRARRGDRLQIDAVNEIQIEERAALGITELRQRFATATASGVRGRARMPAPVRAMPLWLPPPVGWTSLGFIYDIVYTRDAWMHRIDLCRATGVPWEFTAGHDALIIADAARAWQHITGAAGCILTGPTGERLTIGSDLPADAPAYDAVTFVRALSGRGELPGIPVDTIFF